MSWSKFLPIYEISSPNLFLFNRNCSVIRFTIWLKTELTNHWHHLSITVSLPNEHPCSGTSPIGLKYKILTPMFRFLLPQRMIFDLEDPNYHWWKSEVHEVKTLEVSQMTWTEQNKVKESSWLWPQSLSPMGAWLWPCRPKVQMTSGYLEPEYICPMETDPQCSGLNESGPPCTLP